MYKITEEELKYKLQYNKFTGLFYWKIKTTKTIPGQLASWINGNRIKITINGTNFFAHRLAWLYEYGYCSEYFIDHKNKIPYNNWISNLREISHACNIRNCNVGKNNKSGITGISWYESRKCWTVNIYVNGKNKWLGNFKQLKDAAKIRWEAEKKYKYTDCDTSSSAYNFLINGGEECWK